MDQADIFKVHRKLGHKFCLSRGIPNVLLSFGTPDEVRKKVAEYSRNGCTCPILYPLGEDVKLMIDTFAQK